MDYSIILEEFKNHTIVNNIVDPIDIEYLIANGIPSEIIDFYEQFEAMAPIELNEIEMLSIDGIRLRNDMAIPGYLIHPLGYCVIAGTIYGDVFCIERNKSYNETNVYIASHDEIYEGIEIDDIKSSMIKVNSSLYEFLIMFLNEKLASDYYDYISD